MRRRQMEEQAAGMCPYHPCLPQSEGEIEPYGKDRLYAGRGLNPLPLWGAREPALRPRRPRAPARARPRRHRRQQRAVGVGVERTNGRAAVAAAGRARGLGIF